jgi:predicted transposase YdaD
LRADYGGLARIFAELADRSQVWNQGLEGYNVETSQVVQEWMRQGEVKGRAEGEARGEAKGRAEGMAEGRQLLQAKLLKLLRTRFAAEPAGEVVQAVQAQQDLEVLGRWFDLGLTANSLEQAQAGILAS